MLAPLVPLALIGLAVGPYVLAFALSLASRELADVQVSVLVHLVAVPLALLLQPLALIDITI